MNTPVSFPIAKLLKEKRFDEPCISFYDLVSNQQINNTPLGNYNLTKQSVSIPTIIDVVMWLYEKHGIWMFTDRTNNWFWTIQKSTGENIHQEDLPITEKFICHGFNSPTEAYEAAIEYTLKNLI